MGAKVNAQLPPMEIKPIDGRRPPMTRAAESSQAQSIALTTVVRDVLIRHYGSLKAAALTFEMDLGQLSRELADGNFKLRRLDSDSALKVLLAQAMAGTFGDNSPKSRRRRLIRDLRQRLDELDEIEDVA